MGCSSLIVIIETNKGCYLHKDVAFEERRLKNVVIIEETIEGKPNAKKEEQLEQVSTNALIVVANPD